MKKPYSMNWIVLGILAFATLTTACSVEVAGVIPAPTATREVTMSAADADGDSVADTSDRCDQGQEDGGRWGSDAADGCPGTMDDLLELAAVDINSFWDAQFKNEQALYEPPLKIAAYTEPIETGCGESTAGNAFFCSADHAIYFDRNFLEQELENNGDFAPVMIIAHEWGHLVQSLVGDLHSSSILSIELELQADCLAGTWSADADQRGLLEQGDFDEAVAGLFKAGDAVERPFDPTAHGTSEQRIRAFRTGFSGGSSACGLK